MTLKGRTVSESMASIHCKTYWKNIYFIRHSLSWFDHSLCEEITANVWTGNSAFRLASLSLSVQWVSYKKTTRVFLKLQTVSHKKTTRVKFFCMTKWSITFVHFLRSYIIQILSFPGVCIQFPTSFMYFLSFLLEEGHSYSTVQYFRCSVDLDIPGHWFYSQKSSS